MGGLADHYIQDGYSDQHHRIELQLLWWQSETRPYCGSSCCAPNHPRVVQHGSVCLCSLRNLRNCSTLLLLSSWARLSELGYIVHEELALHRVNASSVPRRAVQHIQPRTVLCS